MMLISETFSHFDESSGTSPVSGVLADTHGPNPRVNILLAWSQLVSPDHAGAVRGFVFAKAIDRLGWNPVIVTPSKGSREHTPVASNNLRQVKLYDTYSGKLPPPLSLFVLPLTVARLATVAQKNNVDAIVSSTPALFLPLEAFLVSRLKSAKYVLDVRDGWKLEEITHRGRARNWFKRNLERFLCRRADRVLTVSGSLRDLLVKDYRLSQSQVLVVPNGAQLEDFLPWASPTEKSVDLLFLGAPSLYRDVTNLLRAFRLLSRLRDTVRIRWVGWRQPHIDREGRDDLEYLTSRKLLELFPPLFHRDVPRLMRDARLGVVSLSKHEIFRTAIGAKTYEYIAAGLPIICLGPSGDSELRRFVETNEVGLFATSPEEFARLAFSALTDDRLSSILLENCRKTAPSIDNIGIVMEALEEIVARYGADRGRVGRIRS